MVSGVAPNEASDRLIIFQVCFPSKLHVSSVKDFLCHKMNFLLYVIFQNRFDALWRKYITYSGGEELFGLTVTEYPGLMKIKRELNLLQKLYGLYNDVIDTVNGYYDIMWTDVDIEKINQELLEFQNR